MQSLAWYVQRVGKMSAAEIAWRVKSLLRDLSDRYRFAWGWYPRQSKVLGRSKTQQTAPFHVSELKTSAWKLAAQDADEARWCSKLIQKAENIAQGRLSFFDLVDCDLGDPIDWHRDPGSGKTSPLIYAQAIDYRDFNRVGDCKLVWEPNRHHQWVVLARAYRASGEARFAEALVQQLLSWLAQNPFGKGMNWRSPLELGIRLINWIWALDLIRDASCLTTEVRQAWIYAIYLHCWDISRKFSRGSSANNHLVGEAAGVFVATSYFPGLHNAQRWRNESRMILEREIQAQTYADGCTKEQALGYQFFVIQFYLICGLVGRWSGSAFSESYWSCLQRLLEFTAALAQGGDQLPMFGDRDDGYVLDLGSTPEDMEALMGIAATLFQRADFAMLAPSYCEPAWWLLGESGRKTFAAMKNSQADAVELESKAFPESGYYLLQAGQRRRGDAISVLFDCGELGFGPIAAHGHADALSFVLRVNGADVFVDPGTFDYFTYPEWRRYFRSTRAHNTLEIDGENQSVLLGPFMWGQRANCTCVQWQPTNRGGEVVAEHDGYTRLDQPVVHRRSLELNADSRLLSICDELNGEGQHRIRLYFHLSEHVSIERISEHSCTMHMDQQQIILEADPSLTLKSIRGQEQPIGGWVSRGYHQRQPSHTLIAEGKIQCNAQIKTLIRIP